MLSKNNIKELVRKNARTKQRFTICKLTVGVVSLLVGLTFAGGQTASASEVTVQPADTAVQTSATNQSDDTKVNSSTAVTATNKPHQATAANSAETEIPAGTEPTDNKTVSISTSADEQQSSTLEVPIEKSNENAKLGAEISESKIAISGRNSTANVKMADQGTKDNPFVAVDPNNEELNRAKELLEKKHISTKDNYIFNIYTIKGTNTKIILAMDTNDPTGTTVNAYEAWDNYYYYLLSDSISIPTGGKGWIAGIFIHNNATDQKIPNSKDNPQGNISLEATGLHSIIRKYGLGAADAEEKTGISEITPVKQETPVIGYYYLDAQNKLHKFNDSDKYTDKNGKEHNFPNVYVSGWTGQKFNIDDVQKYNLDIDGYTLVKKPNKDSFAGTLSQFEVGKYYEKNLYNPDVSILYHQTDVDGTMDYSIRHDGNKVEYNHPNASGVIGPNKISEPVEVDNQTIWAPNPYVKIPGEARFIYVPNDLLNDTQKRTITYKYADDVKGDNLPALPGKVEQTVNFTRTATYKDGKLTFGDWTPAKENEDEGYSAVETKPIEGYTVSVEPVSETATFDKDYVVDAPKYGENYSVVVTYKADEQTAHIKFYDDTAGQFIQDENGKEYVGTATGKTNTKSAYSAEPTIAALESKGYEFERDDIPDEGIIFDKDVKQTYTVYLKHGIKKITPEDPGKPGKPINPADTEGPKYPTDSADLTDKVTRTINYVKIVDGKETSVANAKVQSAKFTATGKIDKVTGKWVLSEDEKTGKLKETKDASEGLTWSEEVSLPGVAKADMPKVDGYTPDKAVEKLTVCHDDNNNIVDVIYTPDEQHASLIFWDDTENKAIPKTEVINNNDGQTDANIEFVIPDSYDELLSNYNFVGVTNGENEVLGKTLSDVNYGTFDKDDDTNQKFIAHFIHQTKPVTSDDPTNKDDKYNLTTTRTREVIDNYKDKNKIIGKQTVELERTGILDLVTDTIKDNSYTPWTLSKDKNGKNLNGYVVYKNVPSHEGYSIDKEKTINKKVSDEAVKNLDDQTVDSPIVLNYKANDQKAIVKYIDDDATDKDKKVLILKSLTGKSDTKIVYDTQPTINDYISNGYELVGDGTKDDDFVYDHEDGKDQIYEVHFKHGVDHVTNENLHGHDISEVQREGKETIHYDGAGKATPKDNVQTITFTREFDVDRVNGNVLNDTGWNEKSHTFDAVDSPEVAGYYADKTRVAGQTVTPEDLEKTVNVHYAKDATITVEFYDQTNNQVLSNKTKTFTNEPEYKTGYTTTNDKQCFTDKGYEVVGDDTNGQELILGKSNKTYKVTLKHGIETIDPENPGKPGDPINPEDPKSPKYPADSADLTDTVTRVINYVYVDDKGNVTGKVFVDGKMLDKTQTVKFKATGYLDKVTGKWVTKSGKPSKKNWKVVSGSANLSALEVPDLLGYTAAITPDQANVGAIIVKPGSDDIEITVTYKANDQQVMVEYVDDTEDKVIAHDLLTGKTETKSDYSTTSKIAELKNQGYDYISDNIPADGIVFDSKDNADQVYYIHFKHGIKKITPENPGDPDKPINPDNPDGPKYPANTDKDSLTLTGKQTVHYEGAGDKTPSDNVQTTTFEHSLTIDKVTGKIVKDNGWTPASHMFDNIKSPDVAGYYSDKTIVNGQTVTVQNPNVTVEVHYIANNQHVMVEYIDDTEDKVIAHDPLAGKTGTKSDYSTASKIAEFKNKGYELVSDSVPLAGIVFDTQDNADQVFRVHFTHDTEAIDSAHPGKPGEPINPTDSDSPKYPVDSADLTDTVTRTINYVYATKDDNGHYIPVTDKDGNPIVKKQSVTFTATGQIDKVTGKWVDKDGHAVTKDKALTWKADSATLPEVIVRIKPGYKVSQRIIAAVTVNHDDEDKTVTVVYTPNEQTAHIKFVDDDTNGNVLETKDAKGHTDEGIKFNNVADVLERYLSEYNFDFASLVDETPEVKQPNIFVVAKPGAVNHAVKLLTGNVDEAKNYDFGTFAATGNQQFTVHLKHRVEPTTRTKTIHQHIDYLYGEGEMKGQKLPTDIVADYDNDLGYSEAGLVDKTYEAYQKAHRSTPIADKTAWDESSIKQVSFNTVASPNVRGYHADLDVIDPDDVKVTNDNWNNDKLDANDQVKYFANQQSVKITYIDDTTNKIISNVILTGKTKEKKHHSTADQIKKLEDKGYILVSDGVPATGIVLNDHDGVNQNYFVHFKHGYQNVSQPKDIKQTIKYVYTNGNKASDDNIQTLTFNQTGIKDKTTGNVTWKPVATQTTSDVLSPVINGYTSDQSVVKGQTVNFGNQSSTIKVTYAPNDQQAVVKYIDDDATDNKKVLKVDSVTGKSDQKSDYTSQPVIDDLISHGYELVTNGTTDQFTFDHDDRANQTFEVHVKHGSQKVTQQRLVHETIHYQFEDGTKASESYSAEPIKFKRTGIKDLVTGTVDWGPWSDDPQFAEVVSPTIDGYTSNPTKIDPINVSYDSKDIEKTVTYIKADSSLQIVYVDQNHNPITKDIIKGQVGDETPIHLNVPSGWQLVPNQDIPSLIRLTNDDQKLEVIITPTTKKSDVQRPQEKVEQHDDKPQSNELFVEQSIVSDDKLSTLVSHPTEQNENSRQQQLPQTGNDKNPLSLIGMAGLGLLGLTGIDKKRRRNR